MIGRIIMMLIQFLDDTFKNIRCYSKCCQVNECSCTNTDVSIEDEDTHHHHRQSTEESQISHRSHHSSTEDDEGENVM